MGGENDKIWVNHTKTKGVWGRRSQSFVGGKGTIVVGSPNDGIDNQVCARSFLVNYWGSHGFNEYAKEFQHTLRTLNVSQPEHIHGVKIVDLTEILEGKCDVIKTLESQPENTI